LEYITLKKLFSLENKVAIVTGGLGLIGKALCKALHGAGATLIVADIDFDFCNKFADELGESAYPLKVDVADEKSVISAKKEILYRYGKIDILVNSAAINDVFNTDDKILEKTKFENYPLELWNKSLSVNVTGTFLTCKYFGGEMAKRKSGSIINIASTYGIVSPDQSIYMDEFGQQKFYKSASYPAGKSAVIGLTRYLAAYWGKYNVRVNSLSPGGVEDGQDKFFISNYSRKTPLNRMAKPEDYMGGVVFLASDSSSYMSGANLIIDGGWTIW